jgi:hypothetical protein
MRLCDGAMLSWRCSEVVGLLSFGGVKGCSESSDGRYIPAFAPQFDWCTRVVSLNWSRKRLWQRKSDVAAQQRGAIGRNSRKNEV